MNRNKELINYLSGFVTPDRMSLFQKVVSMRSKYITVALENIYQSQNASAVLRTCDCFGVQNVHIIENSNTFEINPDVALGSSKWLTLHNYNQHKNNTLDAIQSIRKKGYRIVATTPHTDDVTLENFDLNKGPVALFFGTELNGLSQQVIDNADEFLKIPMVGFTESLNISVSAAVILHFLSFQLHQLDVQWKLTENEQDELLIDWLRTSIRKGDSLVDNFFKNNPN
jgi:tRNA (guanosine-2'-O-)-methyltransferase